MRVGLAAAVCAITLGGQKPMDPTRTIDLAAPARTFVLGVSIPVGVRYTNRSPNEVRFRDPRKTWEVQLSVGSKDLPFGKIIRSVDSGVMSWSIEPAETIALAPNAEFTFQYDAGKRWPEAFKPGRLQLQIKDMTDDAVTLVSKKIEIQVAFTADSVPALLAILEDPESTQEAKDFAQLWIKRIHPEHANAAGTRAWWTKSASSAHVAETITRMNQDVERR